jgi:peptide/nickel transport system permease protein
MTDFTIGKERPSTGLGAIYGHARYVIGENRVTGFAFGLFILIVLAALFGPYIVPYDPLASDTAATLQAPSAKHWFGTDQIGRDVFSRVIVATRLDRPDRRAHCRYDHGIPVVRSRHGHCRGAG